MASRRGFLKAAALGAAGMTVAGWRVPRRSYRPAAGTVRLGVASYSLRKFDREEAIAMIRTLETPYVAVKSFHLPYESTPEEVAAAVKQFHDAGLQIVGGGTITFEKDDDDDIRPYFEYAKRAGMPVIIAAPRPDNLARLERFVKAYDIRLAIHNHGPEDPYFPAPSDALALIKDMDPRMGVCIDVGHTTRTGADVVQAIADAGPRLLDMHMKDLRDLMDKDSQCIVGQGQMPVADILAQLIAMGYQGCVNLEYEIDEDDPLPGMKQSFAYLRGVLAGLQHSAGRT